MPVPVADIRLVPSPRQVWFQSKEIIHARRTRLRDSADYCLLDSQVVLCLEQ